MAETPKDERKTFLLRMPPELHVQLRQYAIAKGKPLNEILLAWIDEGWKQQPERESYVRLTSGSLESPKKATKKETE